MNKTDKVARIIIIVALIGILALKCIQLHIDTSYLIIVAAIAIAIGLVILFRKK